MKRGPFSFACCCNRMSEFYSFDDIDYFTHNVELNNLDIYVAMQWLDMQTRTNYVTGVDKGPDIQSSLLRYLLSSGLEDILHDDKDE